MSMPGFTADATLYRAGENYKGAPARQGVGRGNAVIPQEPSLCDVVLDEFYDVCDLFGSESGECDGARQLLFRVCE